MTLDQQAIVFRLQDEKGEGGGECSGLRSASQTESHHVSWWWSWWYGVCEELNSHLLHRWMVTSVSSTESPLVTDMLQPRES